MVAGRGGATPCRAAAGIGKLSGMLASIRSPQEARLALAAHVDLIDLKDPSNGALGALDARNARRIVELVGARVPTSATIGDLPCRAEILGPAIRRTAALGVDLVKAGIFASRVGDEELAEFARQSRRGIRIVLVYFAEFWDGSEQPRRLGKAGIAGMMLDTAHKQTGALTRKLEPERLRRFVGAVQSTGMLCGLAGSLSADDVPALLPLGADYLGFRGALCRDGRRGSALYRPALRRIRGLLPQSPARIIRSAV